MPEFFSDSIFNSHSCRERESRYCWCFNFPSHAAIIAWWWGRSREGANAIIIIIMAKWRSWFQFVLAQIKWAYLSLAGRDTHFINGKTGILVYSNTILFFGVTQFGYCHALYLSFSLCFLGEWVGIFHSLSLSYERISNARWRPTNTHTAIHLIELRVTQYSRMLACTFAHTLSDKLIMKPKPEATTERNDQKKKKNIRRKEYYITILSPLPIYDSRVCAVARVRPTQTSRRKKKCRNGKRFANFQLRKFSNHVFFFFFLLFSRLLLIGCWCHDFIPANTHSHAHIRRYNGHSDGEWSGNKNNMYSE